MVHGPLRNGKVLTPLVPRGAPIPDMTVEAFATASCLSFFVAFAFRIVLVLIISIFKPNFGRVVALRQWQQFIEIPVFLLVLLAQLWWGTFYSGRKTKPSQSGIAAEADPAVEVGRGLDDHPSGNVAESDHQVDLVKDLDGKQEIAAQESHHTDDEITSTKDTQHPRLLQTDQAVGFSKESEDNKNIIVVDDKVSPAGAGPPTRAQPRCPIRPLDFKDSGQESTPTLEYDPTAALPRGKDGPPPLSAGDLQLSHTKLPKLPPKDLPARTLKDTQHLKHFSSTVQAAQRKEVTKSLLASQSATTLPSKWLERTGNIPAGGGIVSPAHSLDLQVDAINESAWTASSRSTREGHELSLSLYTRMSLKIFRSDPDLSLRLNRGLDSTRESAAVFTPRELFEGRAGSWASSDQTTTFRAYQEYDQIVDKINPPAEEDTAKTSMSPSQAHTPPLIRVTVCPVVLPKKAGFAPTMLYSETSPRKELVLVTGFHGVLPLHRAISDPDISQRVSGRKEEKLFRVSDLPQVLCEAVPRLVAGSNICIVADGPSHTGRSRTLFEGTDGLGLVDVVIDALLVALGPEKKENRGHFIDVSCEAVEVVKNEARELQGGYYLNEAKIPIEMAKDEKTLWRGPLRQDLLRLHLQKVLEQRTSFSQTTSLSRPRGHLVYTVHVIRHYSDGSWRPVSLKSKLTFIDLVTWDQPRPTIRVATQHPSNRVQSGELSVDSAKERDELQLSRTLVYRALSSPGEARGDETLRKNKIVQILLNKIASETHIFVIPHLSADVRDRDETRVTLNHVKMIGL